MNTRTQTKALITALLAGTMLFSACGGDDAPIAAPVDAGAAPADTVVEPPAEVAGESTVVAPAATAGAAVVTSGETAVGTALVGEKGLTLYGFTNDTAAASTCNGACAEAWPPLIVSPDWNVAPDLDLGIFATTERNDGQLQLVAGKWPLYYFAGDLSAGEIGGQGSGDVWFVAGTDGFLLDGDGSAESAAPAEAAAAAAIVGTGTTDAGDVLVDEAGLSLYGFLDDPDGVPTCVDACADAWPPVIVDGAELPVDLDPDVFSVVARPDGSNQLKAGIWPLYRFAGDGAPGDINGQESGDVWFLAAPDGGLIKPGDPAPAEEAPAEEAPAEEEPAEEDNGY